MLSAAMYVGVAVNASMPLPQLMADIETFLGLMELHNQTNVIQFLRPNMQFVMHMMGRSDKSLVRKGGAMNEQHPMNEAISTQNVTVIALIFLVKLIISSYMRNYEDAEDMAMELANCSTGVDSFPCFSSASMYLHTGIVSVALSNKR